MSEEIGLLTKTGSRDVDMTVTRYAHEGDPCYQLTAFMENEEYGYIQLTLTELLELVDIIYAHELKEKK